MTGQNSFWFANPSTGFYNGVATQSLRITGNGYLNHGHGSAPTLDTKGTVAFWIKLHNNDDRNYVIQNYQANNNNGLMDIRFGGSSTQQGMHIGQYGRTPYTASTTGPKQRDFNAWYHCLVSFDSTSSTASDRQMKIFINGTQVTTGTFGAISQNDKFPLTAEGSNNGGVTIGRHVTVGYYTDMYLADFYCIDGQALTPDSFTEIKNGICIPKAYDGTYGNNGFRLEFKQTGTNADASGLGADTSGNGNHFTVNSLSAHDSNMPDSPENNFATLNILQERSTSSATFSEGNLKAVGASASVSGIMTGTFGVSSGKWYWEVLAGGSPYLNTGVVRTPFDPTISADSGYGSNEYVYLRNGNKYNDNSSASYGASYADGDIIGVALDLDNDTLTFYKNNSSQGTAYSSLPSGTYLPIFDCYNGSSWILNAGQDSSFAGAKTAQGNADGNGVGDFYYSPPSGYLALCSSNLSDTTLSPDQDEQAGDHFNTVLYTGDGNSSHAITGVGFQPDWVWIKERNGSTNHGLHDSSRVSSGNEAILYSNDTDAESTGGAYLSSFDSDGFTLNNNSSGNTNNDTYVAWNWKVNGGTTSSNTNGDITSTVQVNNTAGFSLILYTGFGEAVKTVGHGLSQAPEMILFKTRGSGNWFVYHKDTGNTGYTFLNEGNAFTSDSNFLNNTTPSSTLITLGTSSAANAESTNYVAYAFHSIEGYSKFGSYTGNNSTDGTFVYTGFRPAMIILKRSSDSGGWQILDNKRNTFNAVDRYLLPNLPNSEYDGSTLSPAINVDFLSNGFKLRTTESVYNSSGGTFIYMAFAEQPFKFSNAR